MRNYVSMTTKELASLPIERAILDELTYLANNEELSSGDKARLLAIREVLFSSQNYYCCYACCVNDPDDYHAKMHKDDLSPEFFMLVGELREQLRSYRS